MAKTKLALGTAQLGMHYGVANQSGKPDCEAAFRILNLACRHNVKIWDTSPVYGDSEEIIGKFLKTSLQKPKISSKLPSLSGNGSGKLTRSTLSELVGKAVLQSLASLGTDVIDYYLIHDERDFRAFGLELLDVLHGFKVKGLLDNIGISVYSPDIATTALQSKKFDALQLPYNLFDRRFSHIISQAFSLGVTVFTRSVFLQGLFFLSSSNVREFLPEATVAVKKLNFLSEKYERSIAEIALCYVRDTPGIDAVLIGVETPEQLIENLSLFSAPTLSKELRAEIDESFANLPTCVVNPSTWKRTVRDEKTPI